MLTELFCGVFLCLINLSIVSLSCHTKYTSFSIFYVIYFFALHRLPLLLHAFCFLYFFYLNLFNFLGFFFCSTVVSLCHRNTIFAVCLRVCVLADKVSALHFVAVCSSKSLNAFRSEIPVTLTS